MPMPGHEFKATLITLTGILFFLSPSTCRGTEMCLPPPTTDEQCLECHQKTVDAAMGNHYIHQPFREKKCRLCHLGGEIFTPGKSTYKSDLKVAWLGNSSQPSVEHWFPLPKAKVTGNIYLDVLVPGHGVYRSVIEEQDYSDLPELALDRTPPKLSDIKIAGMEKSLLISASISWVTDELADTRITYGSGKTESTIHVPEMTRSHLITIPGLKDNTEYRFRVGSADYLGNLAESAPATLSTGTPITPAKQELIAQKKEETTWDREIFQDSQAGLIILKVTSSTPTMAAAGVDKEAKRKRNGETSPDTKRKPCRHQLKSALETGITICQSCHPTYCKGGRTLHPLLVKPKAGMVIPPEFFVLADGRITCMTCHSAHSSDYPYRLVLPGREELCRSCHSTK